METGLRGKTKMEKEKAGAQAASSHSLILEKVFMATGSTESR
jgi:hypothetical protein